MKLSVIDRLTYHFFIYTTKCVYRVGNQKFKGGKYVAEAVKTVIKVYKVFMYYLI